MILSMYTAALMMVALCTLESVMPGWLTWVCTLGPCVCYIIADIRYSQLKKRIKELEQYKYDTLRWWNQQMKINENSNEISKLIHEEIKKLVMEDDGK